MRRLYANTALLLCALIWGTAFVAQSVGMDYVGPFTFQSARFLIGSIVLIPLILVVRNFKKKRGIYKKPTAKQTKQLIRGSVLCGIALCAASCLQQVGLQYTTVGKAGFLTAMYIVIVPILGLFMGRRIQKKVILCVVLSVIGLYLISITESFSISKGDATMCVCAVIFAVHIMMIDRFASDVDGIVFSCVQFAVAGVLAAIPMLIFEKPDIAALSGGAIPILYAGVLSCGGAYTLQIIGQQNAEPVVATLLMSLESVFSMLGGVVILHQIPTLKVVAGCVLMLIAVVLLQVPVLEDKKTRPAIGKRRE